MKKTILHTGSSSGIGLESIKLLLNSYKVVSLSRRKPDVKSENLFHYPVDFKENCQQTIKQIISSHGAIDSLVLCHGMAYYAPIENLSYEQINEMMQVNFNSYIQILKTILPHLKTKEFSRVVTIGSVSAIRGGREGSIYCASKFALRGFIESIQEESSRSGVHFTQIHPGMVRTPFFDDHHIGPGVNPFDAIEPKDIAPIIEHILNSRPGTIIDDIRIRAVNHVVRKKNKGEK